MAELTESTDDLATSTCCPPEQQTDCCKPSEKAECCVLCLIDGVLHRF